MKDTAKLVMASPPSLVHSVLTSLNVQPETVLGDLQPPSQHSGVNQERLDEILAVARRESGTDGGPDVLAGLGSLPNDATPDQVLDMIGRIASGELSPDDTTTAALASIAADDARSNQVRAAAQARRAAEIEEAVHAGGPLGVQSAREEDVQFTDRIAMVHGESEPVSVVSTADGVMYWETGEWEYTLLYEVDGVAYPIGVSPTDTSAKYQLRRLPVLMPLEPLPEDATELQKLAWQEKRDAQLQAMGVAAASSTDPASAYAAAQRVLSCTNIEARLRDNHVTADLDVELIAASARHRRIQRERAAATAAEEARAAALASGGTQEAADEAAQSARIAALGTPTRNGAVVPEFGHNSVPASIEENKYTSTINGGIRPWGAETAGDYEVIARRRGNPKAWGFTTHLSDGGHIMRGVSGPTQLSDYEDISVNAEIFVDEELKASHRNALRAYTGGDYKAINEVFTGRTEYATPATKKKCAAISDAFRIAKNSTLLGDPLEVVRGTRVPPGWGNDVDGFLNSTFKPGSRVEIGQVASFSTDPRQASGFTGKPPYYIVASTRSGIPLRPLSKFPTEDEVALPPGHNMRCVHIDRVGFNGAPVVYLVDEEMAAEADLEMFGSK